MSSDIKEFLERSWENNPLYYIHADNTKKIWQIYQDKIKQTEIIYHGNKTIQIPYFLFDNLSKDIQLDIAYSLSNATIKDNRILVYEIGCGTSLSPITAAAKEKGETVIAFDAKAKPDPSYRAGTISLDIPSPDMESYAAFFNLDINDIDTSKLARSKLAYSISPFPNSIDSFINFGIKVSDEVIIVPNPRQKIETFDSLKSIQIPNVDISLHKISKDQITELIGSTESAFIDNESSQFGVNIISVKRK